MSGPGVRLSRAEQTQRTRERLLAAADDVFARRGFFAATFEEISALAGCTRAAVYKHFPTKAALYVAFFDTEVERRHAAMESALQQTGDDATKLAAFGAACATALTGPGRWQAAVMEYGIYLSEQVAEDPELHEAFLASERAHQDRIGHAVAGLCESLGVEPPLPLDELTIVVCSMGIGFAAFVREDPDLDVARLFTDALTVLLTRGRPTPPAAGENVVPMRKARA